MRLCPLRPLAWTGLFGVFSMNISDRYPELIDWIESINWKIKFQSIEHVDEVSQTEYVQSDIKRGRRSFWKTSYPYFRPWNELSRR